MLYIDESETLKTTASKIPWTMNEVDLKHVILMSFCVGQMIGCTKAKIRKYFTEMILWKKNVGESG